MEGLGESLLSTITRHFGVAAFGAEELRDIAIGLPLGRVLDDHFRTAGFREMIVQLCRQRDQPSYRVAELRKRIRLGKQCRAAGIQRAGLRCLDAELNFGVVVNDGDLAVPSHGKGSVPSVAGR